MAEKRLTHTITVDLAKETWSSRPVLVQNSDNTFLITVLNDGEPADLSDVRDIVLAAIPSRNKANDSVFSSGVKVGSTSQVKIDLGRAAVATPGTVQAQLKLTGTNGGLISSTSFNFEVQMDAGLNFQPSENELTLIETVLGDGPTVLANATQTIADMESTQATLTGAVGGAISTLNEDKAAAIEELDTAKTTAVNELAEVREANRYRQLDAVATVVDRDTTYPNPEHGDTVRITSTATMYKYDKDAGWVVSDRYEATAVDALNQQLADIVINVKAYYNPSEGDWTGAIRRAIEATPRGGTLFFPPRSGGYFCKNKEEKHLFKIDKPISVVGYGPQSSIVLDENIPIDTDVFLISPSSASNIEGYSIEGLQIIGLNGAAPARHAIHLDTTLSHQKIARSLFARNFIYPTGGWSIFLSNPTNSDGFFTSQIQKNLIYSGINLQRGGDSLIVTENTIAGHNGLDVSLVSGSNSFIFAYNNYTARGPIIFRNGHNIKVMYNNLEVGYADATYGNNALLDIDGTNNTNSWGLLAVEVLGNNFTYRATAPDGVTGIRINKARGTLVEGNFIANKNSTMIDITNLAQETRLGYNLYSGEYPDGIIVDKGRNTTREVVHKRNTRTGINEVYEIDSTIGRWKANEMWDYFKKHYVEGISPTDVPAHVYRWNAGNSFNSKHSLKTQQRNADGTLGTEKDFAFIGDGYLGFEQGGLVIKDADGYRWKIQVNTDGTLSTVRI